jgi:hypothetical protein
MKSRIVHYGARFSRELRDMIRELRKFNDELLDEAHSLSIESGLDYSQSESNPKGKIEIDLFPVISGNSQRVNYPIYHRVVKLALRHSLPTAQLRSILGTMAPLWQSVRVFNMSLSEQ